MLAAVMQGLRLVQLGDGPLHLRVVLVHLCGVLAALLDHLRARVGERGAVRQRKAHGDGRDGQELSHPELTPSGHRRILSALNRGSAAAVPRRATPPTRPPGRSAGGSGRKSAGPSSASPSARRPAPPPTTHTRGAPSPAP